MAIRGNPFWDTKMFPTNLVLVSVSLYNRDYGLWYIYVFELT